MWLSISQRGIERQTAEASLIAENPFTIRTHQNMIKNTVVMEPEMSLSMFKSSLPNFIASLTLVVSGGTVVASAADSVTESEKAPYVEFAFEERVTIDDAVVIGDTALGHRQYIPITGGTVTGPKLNGVVVPGGRDYQLWQSNGCGSLSADYFLRTDDGTIIHILNESFSCTADQAKGIRSFLRPRFEAPKGKYEWMTTSTFVATLELEKDKDNPSRVSAVRIRFYQIK
jgi:hypothetical protein